MLSLWIFLGIVSVFAVLFMLLWFLRRRLEAGRPTYDFTSRAEAIRGAPKVLPMDRDENIVWRVAQAQCKFEAEFAMYVLLMNSHLGPIRDKADAYRRALATTLLWHGEDPQNPPTNGLFDILHKEDAAAP